MNKINTKEDFKVFVESVRTSNGYKDPIAFGICRIDKGQKTGATLQATYPLINWKESFGSSAVFIKSLQETGEIFDFSQSEAIFEVTKKFLSHSLERFEPFIEETMDDPNSHKNISLLGLISNEIDLADLSNFRIVFLFDDQPLKSPEATYLKLYAISQRKTGIRTVNLNGAFASLKNVAWVGNHPIELEWLRENEMSLKVKGEFPKIDFVDKFPRMLQHVIPDNNTRILDGSKVRMGAYISAGTTVMPGASYINFNAGTTGVSMVEGRISSSASVGDGSDVGGGASILGVLSGTNGNPVSIGKNCLLGANSVCGIPLGDGCIIDAGLSILEGTKITVSEIELAKLQAVNKNMPHQKVFKGKELAGFNGLHFRQNSENGRMELFRSKREVKLNSELH